MGIRPGNVRTKQNGPESSLHSPLFCRIHHEPTDTATSTCPIHDQRLNYRFGRLIKSGTGIYMAHSDDRPVIFGNNEVVIV
jgi:hypothetical protein